jgi:peptide-methionine (S)-S-oxide reductase
MPNNTSPGNNVRTSLLIAAAIAVGGATVFLSQNDSPFGGAVISDAMAAEGISIAAPTAAITEPKGTQVAVFAGGCFWGIEGVFEHVRGVTSAESGYAGGRKADAEYETVSSGGTGHAEAVRVRYDPAKVSYNQLLHIFFSVAHDPTQKDRQGPDTGRQYRSAIFPANDVQSKAASAYIAQLGKSGAWKRPIATRIESYGFFPAEAYHQDFMAKNPQNSYIRSWDLPKIAALKRLFPKVDR